jgi:hypothetical protein
MAGSFTLEGTEFAWNDTGEGAMHSVRSNNENVRVEATFRIKNADPYSRRGVALRALRDTVEYVPTAAGGYLRRKLPHSHPEAVPILGFPVYCVDAGYSGQIAKTSALTVPNHYELLVTANYEGLPYKLVEDAAMRRTSDGVSWPVDESWFFSGHFKRFVSITPPAKNKHRVDTFKGGDWKIAEGPKAGERVLQATFIHRHETEYSVTWHHVPIANIPMASIELCQGRLNNAKFMWFATETLRFDAWGWRPVTMVDGVLACDITYVFTHNPFTHNRFPIPRDGGTRRRLVSASDGTTTPYLTANFRRLLRPELPVSD